jgi:hypothetical protein
MYEVLLYKYFLLDIFINLSCCVRTGIPREIGFRGGNGILILHYSLYSLSWNTYSSLFKTPEGPFILANFAVIFGVIFF